MVISILFSLIQYFSFSRVSKLDKAILVSKAEFMFKKICEVNVTNVDVAEKLLAYKLDAWLVSNIWYSVGLQLLILVLGGVLCALFLWGAYLKKRNFKYETILKFTSIHTFYIYFVFCLTVFLNLSFFLSVILIILFICVSSYWVYSGILVPKHFNLKECVLVTSAVQIISVGAIGTFLIVTNTVAYRNLYLPYIAEKECGAKAKNYIQKYYLTENLILDSRFYKKAKEFFERYDDTFQKKLIKIKELDSSMSRVELINRKTYLFFNSFLNQNKDIKLYFEKLDSLSDQEVADYLKNNPSVELGLEKLQRDFIAFIKDEDLLNLRNNIILPYEKMRQDEDFIDKLKTYRDDYLELLYLLSLDEAKVIQKNMKDLVEPLKN